MDMTAVSALSGVLGSLVGGSATIATAWITQKTGSRRELIRLEIKKREALYGEYISECARLLVDAYAHTLEKPEVLLPAIALINRIRLSASQPVLSEAERLLLHITDQYFARNLTIEDMHRLTHSPDADPIKSFGDACRTELKSMRARV
jgi:hypothetical protein